MGPTPTSVFVKDGMMYHVVGKSATNFGIVSVSVAEDLYTFPVAVSTLICEALVLGGIYRADGGM